MNREIGHVPIDYSKYFVAFLDVLGFQKLVFSNNPNDKVKIEDYLMVIKEITSDLEFVKTTQSLKSIIISDSIILSVPFGNAINDALSQLRHLCIAVGKIQFQLALDNIWLRGAISCGDAYFNQEDNQVVGPAYVTSYLLEQNAIYPRVILDNKIVNDLEMDSAQALIDSVNRKNNGGLHFQNWQPDKILFEWQDDAIANSKIKKDITCFIDYLLPSTYDQSLYFQIVNHIRSSIYSDPKVYTKFRWVADYLIDSTHQSHAENIEFTALHYGYLGNL